jgi:TonB dependent receptor/Carboxypeptidase regulatory-like domain
MKYPVLFLILVVNVMSATAQTDGARISGRITDQSDAVIVGSACKITNIETNVSITAFTNDDGIYVVAGLRPATYRLTIQKEGFRTVVQPSLQLFVQDAINENFTLALGLRSETITIEGEGAVLQTDSAAVSTVVTQTFVDNMPLNGRSFQSLIALAPGVVFTSQNDGPGQFSVNGQRSDANYFMVDGVGANFGVLNGYYLGQSIGGAIPGFTSGGGTNGLVSVDAMQEFRIQTSSYAPEFGHTPGGQISIVTKSGTNQFHGTLYDYLRNEAFDARNYFDDPSLPKPPLRQNDFGGTLGGPIIKDKTFFFFSYEGLRLLMPQTAQGVFFTASARAAVAPVFQPIVNALPLPTGPLIDPTCDNIANPCLASLTSAYSNPSTLNATSIRVDHNLAGKIHLFARYNHAPSSDGFRDWEDVTYDYVNTDTLTVGATMTLTPTKVNDFRANWSRHTGTTTNVLTDFHGAVVPPTSALFQTESPYSPDHGAAIFTLSSGDYGMEVRQGTEFANVQRQLNFVDTFNWSAGAHQLAFGIDYRRLSPHSQESLNYLTGTESFRQLVLGLVDGSFLLDQDAFSVNLNNYSLFAQDTWKATNKLTLTYGLRWEINTPPKSATSAQPLYVLQGIFDSNPLAIVPGDLYHTRFGNVAPRIGAAWQITPKTSLRGGFGLFYDLGYGDSGGVSGEFPYQRDAFPIAPASGVPFNLTSSYFQPVPFSTAITPNSLIFEAVDPNLQLPLTMQWNVAIERQLGTNQKLTATYVGADARRLMQEDNIYPPLLLGFGNGGYVHAVQSAGYSHYEALQVQFQRGMSHGLQALVSYSLAKSSDQGSSDQGDLSAGSVSQLVLPPLTPSDFDIRNSIAGAVSYEAPYPPWGRVADAILKGWAVDGLLRLSSAPPIDITVNEYSSVTGSYQTRPDVVPGQPIWIPDSTQPAGRALNPAAFVAPPPNQPGNLPRNGLRSPYSVDQTDLAVRRRFNLTERLNLNVRAEYFNIFNHPMFGAPGFSPIENHLAYPGFGQIGTYVTTNLALGGGGGGTGQSPQYALGGPRSAQFTIKLQF